MNFRMKLFFCVYLHNCAAESIINFSRYLFFGWLSVAACGFSLVAASRGSSVVVVCGLLTGAASLPGSTGPGVHRLQ